MNDPQPSDTAKAVAIAILQTLERPIGNIGGPAIRVLLRDAAIQIAAAGIQGVIDLAEADKA